jgi:hypothetical protein
MQAWHASVMKHLFRALALGAIVLLAAWGCGGGDDAAGTARTGSDTTAATAPGRASSGARDDEGRIQDVGDRFYAAYVTGHGATACALLSAAAKRQVVEDPHTARDGATCAAKLSAAAKVIVQYYGSAPKVSLTKITVSGDGATGVILIAGQSQDVTFERENGEWKLGPDPERSGSTTTP